MHFSTQSWGPGRCWLSLLVALCSLAPPAPLSAAVQINVSYIHVADSPFDDANGTTLWEIANAAASLWEDYLVGNQTYDFDFSWDEDPSFWSSSKMGYCDPNLARIWILDDPTRLGYLPNPLPWFVDLTPLDHSEFSFTGPAYDETATNNNWGGQALYRDLGTSNQNDWFDGSPPSLLEVGYRGTANAMTTQNSYDLFSTVIHEIGHALGVNYLGIGEYGPLPFSQVGGATNVEILSTDIEEDFATHLAARTALMAGNSAAPGVRRLPSAIDILAIDYDEDAITGVDLPRQDFLIGTSWHVGSNWEGGRVPDSEDDTFVRHGGTVTVTYDDVAVNSLLVTEEPNMVVISGSELRALDVGIQDLGEIWVFPGNSALSFKDLLIDNGFLSVRDGQVWSEGELTNSGVIEGWGEILVGAQTSLPLSPDPKLINNGLITTFINGVPGATGQELVIKDTSNQFGRVDLDGDLEDQPGGSATGRVLVTGRDLTILTYHELTDPFNTGGAEPGIVVGADRTFHVQRGWTLGLGGDLQLNGGPATVESDAAVVTGGQLTVQGDIEVPAGKRGHLEAAVRLEATAVINAGAGGALRLAGHTTFVTPAISGYQIEQYGDAYVEENTLLEAWIYDWDGNESAPSTMELAPLRDFTIDAPNGAPWSAIDIVDGYDGTTYVNGGWLRVRTYRFDEESGSAVPTFWTIDRNGTVQLANSLLMSRGVYDSGSQLLGTPVVVEGTIRALGSGNRTDALIGPGHLTLKTNGAIELESFTVASQNAGDPPIESPGHLEIRTEATYSGGTITGDGSIHHLKPVLVDGDVSARVSTFDFDGQQTTVGNQINIQGGRLQVLAAALQDDSNTDLVSSNFLVNNGALMVSRVADPLAPGPTSEYLPWKLRFGSEIELTGNAALSSSDDFGNLAKTGSEIKITGLVTASGNNNTIYAPTRVMFGGRIFSHDDQLEMVADTTIGSAGMVKAVTGGGIRFSEYLDLENAGVLHADGRVLLEGTTWLQGGSFAGEGAIRQDGYLSVKQASTSNVKFLDLDGASELQDLNLFDDFTVNAHSLEYSWTNINNPITPLDPMFNGGLIVFAPATLTMNIGDSPLDMGWTLASQNVWIEPDMFNLLPGASEGGLVIAGSPVHLDNTIFHIGQASRVLFEADVTGSPGQVTGLLQFNGNVSPGTSPAKILSEGSIVFGDTATLVMEIYRALEADGSDPFADLYGSEPFDSFEVAGTIDLGGATMEVIFQGGFQPVAGQSFQLFSASSIMNGFSTIIPYGLPQGLMLDVSRLSEGIVSVAVTPEPAAILLALFGLALLPRSRRR